MNDSKYIESLSKEIEERILDDVSESIHDLIPEAVRKSVQMINEESKDDLVEKDDLVKMNVDKLADVVSDLLADAGAQSIICIEKDNDHAILGGMDAIHIISFISYLVTVIARKAKVDNDEILYMISDTLKKMKIEKRKTAITINLKK